jgi:hypothetical protein
MIVSFLEEGDGVHDEFHISQHSMVCIQCNPNQSAVEVHLGKKGDCQRSYLKKSGEVKTTGSLMELAL